MDLSFLIVNNYQIQLKLKTISGENKKDNNNITKIQNEKKRQIPTSESCSASITEIVKKFNKKNNISGVNDNNISLGVDLSKTVPKKLVINPNLFSKDGQIRIMSSKEQVLKMRNNENNVQNYLYGDSAEEDTDDKKSVKNRKSDIPIPNRNNDYRM